MTDEPVQLNWINYDGKEQNPKIIGPKQWHYEGSCPTHPWSVKTVKNTHTKLIIGGGDKDYFITKPEDHNTVVKIDFFHKSRAWSKLNTIHWHNTLDEKIYCRWHGYDGKLHGRWRQPK